VNHSESIAFSAGQEAQHHKGGDGGKGRAARDGVSRICADVTESSLVPAWIPTTNWNTMNVLTKAKTVWLIEPMTIIDGGAAMGTWTQKTMETWPAAQYLMVDPLQERESSLKAIAISSPNVIYEQTALGKEKGRVKFYKTKHLDSSYVRPSENDGIDDGRGEFREVPVTSLDILARQHDLKPPFFHKIGHARRRNSDFGRRR